MANTSGLSHFGGIVVFGRGHLDRSKIDHRLIAMYDSEWPPDQDTFLLPAHITLEEKDGNVMPLTLVEILKRSPNLKAWNGLGKTGETFALIGIITRGQLDFISTLPGVKFIWLLYDRSLWNYQWPHIKV